MQEKGSSQTRTSRRIHIRPILGSARELDVEILRLMVLYPHDDAILRALGIAREDVAAHRCASLPEPGGLLLAADDGRRLQGLLSIEPVLDQSAVLGLHVWRLGLLIAAPDAPRDTLDAMLGHALGATRAPIDFVYARVPGSDRRVIEGLQRSDFRLISGETVAVLADPHRTGIEDADMDIASLDADRLEDALGIVCGCKPCNPYLLDASMDADRVCRLSHFQLRRTLAGDQRQALIALARDGRVSGVAAFGLDPELQSITGRRIATIDKLCTEAGSGQRRVETSLGRQALQALSERGAEGVVMRIQMNGPPSATRLEAARQMGFQIAGSNLFMSRWVNGQPHRRDRAA
ncbi:MAG: hypothetical protein JXR96_17605 [Deltaproteobacteria bacterium]|nr:hypothetical protein [Deltaproteobacteria bacterium]